MKIGLVRGDLFCAPFPNINSQCEHPLIHKQSSKAKLYNPKKITEIFSKRQIFLMLRIYSRNRVSVQVHYTRSELCEAAAAAQPLHTPRPRGANNPSHPHPEWLNNPSTPRPGGRGLSSFVNYIFRPRGVTFSDIFVLFFRHIFRLILNLYL